MSMYVIAGNGQMPAKEVEAQFADLINTAVNVHDVDIWFMLEAKENPTDTDRAIVKYLDKIQAYYETFNTNNPDPLYQNAEKHHRQITYGNLAPHMAEIAKEEAGETALLGLFVDFDDPQAAGDIDLDSLIFVVGETGVLRCYALNAAMVAVDIMETDQIPEIPKKPVKDAESKQEYDMASFIAASLEEWSVEEISALTVEELRAICPNAPKKATKPELIAILLGTESDESIAAFHESAKAEIPKRVSSVPNIDRDEDMRRIHDVLVQIIDAAASLLNYLKERP